MAMNQILMWYLIGYVVAYISAKIMSVVIFKEKNSWQTIADRFAWSLLSWICFIIVVAGSISKLIEDKKITIKPPKWL